MTRWLRAAAAVALVIAAIAIAPRRAEAQAHSFAEANSAYKDGRYPDAIRAYESLVASGVVHEDLFYNLGNAYFRNNQLGSAIYNYERALRVAPRMLDAHFNIELARQAVAERVVDRLQKAEGESFWYRSATYFSTSQLTLGFLVLDAVFFALLVVWWFLPTGFVRTAVMVTCGFLLMAVILSGVLLRMHINYLYDVQTGVVIADQLVLREGPDEKLTGRAEIHAGLKVRIVARQPGWMRIRLANELEGWAPEYAIGEL